VRRGDVAGAVVPTERSPAEAACGCLPRGGQDGQAAVLLVMALALTALLFLAIVRGGTMLVRAARAQAAADAAALAAVRSGESAALGVAADNGAAVVAVWAAPGWARVTVRLEGREATSTAALVAAGPPAEPPR
jgi:Flp pilus assembly protein TadG